MAPRLLVCADSKVKCNTCQPCKVRRGKTEVGPKVRMHALRKKSLALTELFMRLVDERLSPYGIIIVTPRKPEERGSQVSLIAKEGDYEIVQALIARGVLGDYRAGDGGKYPDILRFGFTPLYLGFSDVCKAVDHLHKVMQTEEWRDPRFAHKNAVT